MNYRRFDLLLAALLLALPILFHWRVLTPNPLDRGSFPQGDFAEQFYAFDKFAYDELSQGRLPLWNPYTYAGHPFIADVQSALFYPPTLLLMLAARLLGGLSLYLLEWQAALHFSLAGVLTFLFARGELGAWRLKPARSGTRWDSRYLRLSLCALLTAITFTFGGYLTAYPSQQLAVLETDVWLPLILLCLLVSAERHRAPMNLPLLLAGLCFGVALLAGHPQSALYVLVVSLAYWFFRARRAGWRWRAVVTSAGLMLLMALGVSAAQWIPSLEFTQLSSRANLSYADYARGFELQDPLQLLLPGSVSAYSPLYVGIAPLALVLCALWLPRRIPRRGWFWLVLALVALAISFGGNLFFYPLAYLFVPGFQLFRQQERAAFIFSFALAMLAGYGALALSRPLLRVSATRLRRLVRLAVGACVGAAILFALVYFAWMQLQLNPASPLRAASDQVAWLTLMLALVSGILYARSQGRLALVALLLALMAISTLDLFTVNGHTNFQSTSPEAQLSAPAFLAPVLADASLFRTYNEYRIFGNFGDVFRVEDTWGASPLRLARYEEFAKLPVERQWAMLNVKYVITWRKQLSVPSEVVAEQKVSDSETTYVHRLQNVGPRTLLLARYDVGQSVAFDAFPNAGVEGDTNEAAELLSRQPGQYVWLLHAPDKSLFVLSENDYPGWRANIDGNAVSPVRFNAIMLAVEVPAGEHRVEFVFDPWSVKIGIGVSALTLAALCIGALFALRRRA